MENFLRGQQADTKQSGGLFDAQADSSTDSSAPTCPECNAGAERFFPADGYCSACRNWTAQPIDTTDNSARSQLGAEPQQHRRAA